MSPENRKPKGCKASCRDFLVFRTECRPDTCECRAGAAETVSQLKDEFPRILCEKDLIASAMECLAEAPSFSAMVVSIDGYADILDPQKAVMDTARSIDGICSKTDGIWGVIGSAMFGAFFPGIDTGKAEKMAEAMQKRLSAPDFATVSVGIAGFPTLSYERRDILENAIKALDHAAFFGPDSRVVFDSVSLNISGDNYYRKGDIDRAIHEYRLALMLDENNANARNSLGVCYGVRGEHDKALAEFMETIRIDENEIMGLYNAGYIYMLKKDYDRALTYFKRAAEIDENVFELAFQTGRVYLEIARFKEAAGQFEKAVSLKPGSSSAHSLFGDALAQSGRAGEAINAYKTALRLQPHNADALSALGFLYEMEGKNAEIAEIFCQKAVDIEPENGLFHHRLGRIYFNRKQFKEALDEFEKAESAGYESGEYIILSKKDLNNENTASSRS